MKNIKENMPNQVKNNESMYNKGEYFLLNLTCSTKVNFTKVESWKVQVEFYDIFFAAWKVEVFSGPSLQSCV